MVAHSSSEQVNRCLTDLGQNMILKKKEQNKNDCKFWCV